MSASTGAARLACTCANGRTRTMLRSSSRVTVEIWMTRARHLGFRHRAETVALLGGLGIAERHAVSERRPHDRVVVEADRRLQRAADEHHGKDAGQDRGRRASASSRGGGRAARWRCCAYRGAPRRRGRSSAAGGVVTGEMPNPRPRFASANALLRARSTECDVAAGIWPLRDSSLAGIRPVSMPAGACERCPQYPKRQADRPL